MKLKSSGIGLIEVLLAVGVLGGLSLVVAKFSKNATEVTNNVEINNDIVSALQQMQAILTDPESCTNTFAGKKANNALNTVQALRLKNNATFVDVFQTKSVNSTITYGQKFLKINSFSLSDAAEDVDVANLGTTHLLVNFDRGTKGAQTESISKKISLRVVVNALGDIVSCSAYNSGQSELWKYTANNSDISFAGGNVSIGTTTSTANLTVRATTMPVASGISIIGNESSTAGWNRSSVGFIDQSSTHDWYVNMFGSASNEGGGSFGINGGPRGTPAINRFIITKDGDVGIGTKTPSCAFIGCPNGIDLQIHNPSANPLEGANLILSSDSTLVNSLVGALALGSLGSPSADKRAAVITGQLFSATPTTSGSLVFWTAHNGSNQWNMILDRVGNLWVRGDITATSLVAPSDRRLKKNIRPLENSLEKILKLRGVSFNWKQSGKKDIGLIAQEVETVYPELVSVNTLGQRAISYYGLLAPITETIREIYEKYFLRQKDLAALKAESFAMKNYLCQREHGDKLCQTDLK